MATQIALAIASEAALGRIEQQLEAMGVELETPIRRTHKDPYMLRKIELEAIAALLEQVKIKPKRGGKATNG